MRPVGPAPAMSTSVAVVRVITGLLEHDLLGAIGDERVDHGFVLCRDPIRCPFNVTHAHFVDRAVPVLAAPGARKLPHSGSGGKTIGYETGCVVCGPTRGSEGRAVQVHFVISIIPSQSDVLPRAQR